MKSLFKWYSAGLLNPRSRWWLIIGSLIYLLSPIDLSPDLLPFAGQIDDVILLIMLISGVSQLLTASLPTETISDDELGDPQPKDAQVKTIDVDAIEVP